jgi:hypothetical protein
MKKRRVLWVALTVLSSSALRAGDRDNLELALTDQQYSNWEVGYSKRSGDVSNTEFVPKGETVKNWTKMLSIQGFRKPWGAPSVQNLAEEFRNALVKKCPGVVFNVIESQKNEVVYEWRVENCLGVEDQHELAKYIQGKWSQFRVAYAHKVKQMEPEEREEWLKVICDTKVTIGKDK